MKTESILFGVIGLLAGLIIGFMGANTLNQRGASGSPSAMAGNSNMPAGHPDIQGNGGPSMQQIQETVTKAKDNPNDFNAQLDAAGVYLQIQRFPDAINFLKQAIQLKPDDLNTMVTLGNALFDSNNYLEAATWYEKALAKQDDVNVRTDYGLTFMFREPADLDRAIVEFKKSLAIDSKHTNTLRNLTAAYAKKNDVAKAKATLAELEKLDPTNEAIPTLKGEIDKLGSN